MDVTKTWFLFFFVFCFLIFIFYFFPISFYIILWISLPELSPLPRFGMCASRLCYHRRKRGGSLHSTSHASFVRYTLTVLFAHSFLSHTRSWCFTRATSRNSFLGLEGTLLLTYNSHTNIYYHYFSWSFLSLLTCWSYWIVRLSNLSEKWRS